MNEKLGDRIRKFRQLKDIKQSYISKMLGLSISAYGKIERGETQITIERLQEIGAFLGFSVSDILEYDIAEKAYGQTHLHGAAFNKGEQEDLKKILQKLPLLLEGQHNLMQKVLQVVEQKI